jgi:hypothetical protein
LIGVLGLILSSLSIFSLPSLPIARAALVVGVFCIFWSVYALRRRPLKLIKTLYEYEFSSRSRKRVKGKKITIWKVVKPNITRLESGYFRASGYYENYSSNIGRITVENKDGGEMNVLCDLDEPLKVGSIVEWVLAFDIIDSFKDSKENVSITANTPGNIGVLYVKFSPKDTPRKMWKSVSTSGNNPIHTPLSINDERPEVYWRFKIKNKRYYTLNWEW